MAQPIADAAEADAAITAQAFAAAMEPFALTGVERIAVAVSGGADSMALLLLLREWSRACSIHMTALTVDHRLRDAAAEEVQQVARWCAALNIPHDALAWEKGASVRHLDRSPQAEAREARYDLMTTWCRDNGAGYLFVAHHADDQVETFLLRLARGSGVDGLAAMAPSTVRDGVILARPLLGFPKAALEATCRAVSQSWIEDPSNSNDASGRVRFRKARALLESEGLSRDRLLATIAHMQRSRAALEHMVTNLLAMACVADETGAMRIAVPALITAPEEIALRALARVLSSVSGQDYGPRFDSLERMFRALKSGPWQDCTLHGCFMVRREEFLLVKREPGRAAL